MKAAWVVFRKELVDAMRDRRTLVMAFLTSVALGPIVLLLLSSLIGDLERRAEQRVILVQGADAAPSLTNFVERQSFRIESAPADHVERLRAGKLDDAVLVVPKDFEEKLAGGIDAPSVIVLGNSSQPASAAATRRAMALVQAFNQERVMLRNLMRGVAATGPSVEVQERDLSNRRARAAQLMTMVPFFVLMAVLYGSMAATMDTTAGERERGSLEPLLMTPTLRWSLVVGKWGAVVVVGMVIALLSCVSFMPAQVLMRSETLAALFQFGVSEALLFLVVLLPFAAAAAAMLMAVAIRAKTFKEAQTNSAGVAMAITMAPMVSVFNQGGESAWQLWVPALAQVTLMNRVLKGEAIGADWLVASSACALVALLGLTFVAASLRRLASSS